MFKKYFDELKETVKDYFYSTRDSIIDFKINTSKSLLELDSYLHRIEKRQEELGALVNKTYKDTTFAEQIFNKEYEKDNIELAIVKTFTGKPMIVFRGKKVDVSDCSSITIYINKGELTELNMES